MELNRAKCLSLMNEGRAAQQAGAESTTCPYDQRGDTEQQVSHRYWTRGWVDAREGARGTAGQ
ncbi:hypothetical protein G3I60_05270 [Streptomyces sp. SID13666]|uniref:Rmf/CrpP family protein n=1 Tax=Streptomyces sp. SID13666 TaxID=2706054 RepID=UPI0013C0D5F2|nr:Rmf/CrpP family protein [Streptomyces sp. SID13666]NEA53581.1 hypothetical protein [Streptomyces sp. SID13666]